LFAEVVRLGEVPFDEVLDSGAAVARCSQETIKRYLRKAASAVGLYDLVEDPKARTQLVRLKPRWAAFRKREEERKTLELQARNWKDETIKGALPDVLPTEVSGGST
jgi:hypothetical protein